MHPPYSSPDLVAAPVKSVVESGHAVLVAHVLCVKTAKLCNLRTVKNPLVHSRRTRTLIDLIP